MATPTTLPATFVAGNVLQAAQLNDLRGAFRILQVVSTTKTDTFTTTSTSATNITGLSAAITPSATSSKVLIFASIGWNLIWPGSANGAFFKLTGGNTASYIGDAAGSRTPVAIGNYLASGNIHMANSIDWGTLLYLDSPNTTSATTYQVQGWTTGGTLVVNRTGDDTNASYTPRPASTITVMEISA